MPPAIHRRMMESAVGAGAAARTSLGSAPMSDANVAAAVTPLLMKPRRSIFELINASSAVNLVSISFKLNTAMNVKPGWASPAGAAIVASRLALYAALIKAGAKTPAGSPTGDQGSTLAKRILLIWASRGFRDQNGKFLNRAEQFCDGQGRFNRLEENNVGLQIATDLWRATPMTSSYEFPINFPFSTILGLHAGQHFAQK